MSRNVGWVSSIIRYVTLTLLYSELHLRFAALGGVVGDVGEGVGWKAAGVTHVGRHEGSCYSVVRQQRIPCTTIWEKFRAQHIKEEPLTLLHN